MTLTTEPDLETSHNEPSQHTSRSTVISFIQNGKQTDIWPSALPGTPLQRSIINQSWQHIHTQPFNSLLAGTTGVGWYQKKTFTHSHPSWLSDILYHLPPFTTIYSILFIQFTCLRVLFDNLFPGPLWSSSWSWTHYSILHTFLHPIIIFFRSKCSYHRSPFCCNNNAMSSTGWAKKKRTVFQTW